MPRRDWRLRAEDIVNAARNIQEYIEGYSFDTFIMDLKNSRCCRA